MIEKLPAFFLSDDFEDIKDIDPEVLPSILALRDKGIETIASCSGACSRPNHRGWGSYIQVILSEEVHRKGMLELASLTTAVLQREFNNQLVELQLMSAQEWYSTKQGYVQSKISPVEKLPVFRLQLVGPLDVGDYNRAWQIVQKGI